ncbi:MAG: hypothetical protein AAFV29_01615, partial [Myxococcota bacterium]
MLLTVTLAGCGFFKTERPGAHPLAFISKDADVVIELRDMGMLMGLRTSLQEQFGKVFRPADIRRLQQELVLMLGFDPTTLEGLKGVGLATNGPVAAELLGDGTGAVWAIPVDEPKKLLPVIETIMKTRGGADEASTETKEGVKLTTFFVEFGPKKAIRAAYTVDRGHLIWGFGPRSPELVMRAVKLAPQDGVRVAPAYKKLVGQLGNAFDARMTSPKGGQAVRSAVRRFARRYAAMAEPVLARITSAGWVARYDQGAVKVDGWIGLDGEGQKQAK